jgi:transcriptional regulator with XRE-family HTH domain
VTVADQDDNDQEEMARAFGDFIRAQRKVARLSQRQVARASGVSDSYLSQMERGMYKPSPEVMKSLAKAFGISPYILYAQFGLLDDEDDAASDELDVELAIRRDTRLTASAKEALLVMYQTLIQQSGDKPSTT